MLNSNQYLFIVNIKFDLLTIKNFNNNVLYSFILYNIYIIISENETRQQAHLNLLAGIFGVISIQRKFVVG